jgi:toxin-antitoxin system PIN domain toxin
VILIDTNLLLYATIGGFPQHRRAEHWLNQKFASTQRIGLPWHSLLGYVRLASNKAAFKNGPSVDEAWATVREWLSSSNVWIPQPTSRHGDILSELFATAKVSSRFVMDMHLAALSIEHDLTVCSNDSDFAQFAQIRWFNPLAV